MSKKIETNNGGRLNVFTLAMLNIAKVISLKGASAEAEYGLSSVFFYVFAGIVFLIPVSLVAAELVTTWPEKGGVFRWVGEAYGAKVAMVAIFLLWIEASIWLPTTLTFGAVALAFTDPHLSGAASLSTNKYFVFAVVAVIYWIATLIALKGTAFFAKVAKWGVTIGTLIPVVLLVAMTIWYLASGETSATPLGAQELLPDFSKFSNVVLAASIFLFFSGMEMNAVHVKELENPTKQFPAAIILSAVVTVIVLAVSTLAVSIIVPHHSINLTQSLLVAYREVFAWAGISWAAPIVAGFLTVGVLAGIIGWVAGPSAGLHAVARGGYLPRFFQQTNKEGMATNILIVQGIFVTLLSSTFVFLPSVQYTYQILSQLTVILYLIMYMMMFLSVIRLRKTQPDRVRPYKLPFGNYGHWIVGGVGLIGSFVAFVFSFIPPSELHANTVQYDGFLIVLTIVALIIPLWVYRIRKEKWKDPMANDFAPFTWETKENISEKKDV